MNEETANPVSQDAAGSVPADAVVSFCQQCGRPLTAGSQRRVGAGIFCEPCTVARTTPAAGWQPVNAGSGLGNNAGYPAPMPQGLKAGEPNPVLAGFLGLIPGVGAMYNGQYPKSAVHLVIFVVLVSLADNLNWVFWWFVWGWVFYQAFDAYHTAQARRDGQPLPDPFGWNELGDRLGMSRNWNSPTPPTAYRATAERPAAPVQPVSPDMPTPTAAPFGAGSSSLGGNPFPPVSFVPQASASPFVAAGNATSVPYAATYSGSTAAPLAGVPDLALASRRFPTGAAWLIGLGILFLLGNLLPSWRIDGRWFVPVLFAGIALWIGGQRLAAMRDRQKHATAIPGDRVTDNIAGLVLGPILLLTVAVLLGLQNASVLPLRHSWPALLIIWGGLLLLERSRSLGRSSAAEGAGSVVPSATDSSLR